MGKARGAAQARASPNNTGSGAQAAGNSNVVGIGGMGERRRIANVRIPAAPPCLVEERAARASKHAGKVSQRGLQPAGVPSMDPAGAVLIEVRDA